MIIKSNEINEEESKRICFALVGSKRYFLDLKGLGDIKTRFPNGIDAIQLFKIPTRRFQDYFYYHDLKWMGKMYRHSFSRLPHDVMDLIKAHQVED